MTTGFRGLDELLDATDPGEHIHFSRELTSSPHVERGEGLLRYGRWLFREVEDCGSGFVRNYVCVEFVKLAGGRCPPPVAPEFERALMGRWSSPIERGFIVELGARP